MVRVRCPIGHITTKYSAEYWRYNRACDAVLPANGKPKEHCAELTVLVDESGCDHPAFRYPRPIPTDGDVCTAIAADGMRCGTEYHEPAGTVSAARKHELRGRLELLAAIIDEAAGGDDDAAAAAARLTSERIRSICRRHHWRYVPPMRA